MQPSFNASFFLLKDIREFLYCYINWACFTVNTMLPLKMLLKSFFGEKGSTTFIALVFGLWMATTGHDLHDCFMNISNQVLNKFWKLGTILAINNEF